jgi:hypothetical protein
MRQIDLVAATLEAWSRLDTQQRERFLRAGLRAALRLGRLQFRAWLLRRLKTKPLAAPIDLTRFAVSDSDFALLMKAVREAPGESAGLAEMRGWVRRFNSPCLRIRRMRRD